MKHHLRQEIEKLIKLLNRKRSELTDEHLYESLRNLYELGVLLQHQSDMAPPNTELGKLQQALFDSLESEAISIQSSPEPIHPPSEHEEVPELMDTIKNMVTEMPESKVVNELFTQIEEPQFVRKEPTNQAVESQTVSPDKPTPNLNERFNTGLKVDLNDRLAFIQHLFDGNSNEYQRALNQLTTFDSMGEAQTFIQNLLKPDYNNWEGKEDYEERFMRLLTQFFETK